MTHFLKHNKLALLLESLVWYVCATHVCICTGVAAAAHTLQRLLHTLWIAGRPDVHLAPTTRSPQVYNQGFLHEMGPGISEKLWGKEMTDTPSFIWKKKESWLQGPFTLMFLEEQTESDWSVKTLGHTNIILMAIILMASRRNRDLRTLKKGTELNILQQKTSFNLPSSQINSLASAHICQHNRLAAAAIFVLLEFAALKGKVATPCLYYNVCCNEKWKNKLFFFSINKNRNQLLFSAACSCPQVIRRACYSEVWLTQTIRTMDLLTTRALLPRCWCSGM